MPLSNKGNSTNKKRGGRTAPKKQRYDTPAFLFACYFYTPTNDHYFLGEISSFILTNSFPLLPTTPLVLFFYFAVPLLGIMSNHLSEVVEVLLLKVPTPRMNLPMTVPTKVKVNLKLPTTKALTK